MIMKIILLSFLLLLISCQAAPTSVDLTEGKQLQKGELLLKKAIEDIKNNNLDDAYKVFIYLIKEIPLFVQLDDNYFSSLDKLIVELKKKRKSDKVREIFLLLNQSFSSNPRYIVWLKKLGDIYYKEEEWLKSQVYYEELVRRYPTEEQAVHAHLQLASIFLNQVRLGDKRGDYILQANIQLQLIQRKRLPVSKDTKIQFDLIRQQLVEAQAKYLLYLANFYKDSRRGYALTKIQDLLTHFPKSSVAKKAKDLEKLLKVEK